MAGTVALACLILGAGGLHAQVTQVLTIKASASVQGGYSTSTNSHTGIITYTYATPTKHSVATKDILALLATDNQTTLPSGAKLVISHVTPPDGVVTLAPDGNSPVINNVNNMDEDFQVVDKNNNLLMDVSDIMSINIAGGNDITSSKSTSSNPGRGTSSNEQLLSISFDDTGVGGNLKFFLTGIRTGKTTDTTPSKTTGAYTESSSSSLSSGTGEGSYRGNPLVCTGTVSTSGKVSLNINHP
jgi:hypothetical protein